MIKTKTKMARKAKSGSKKKAKKKFTIEMTSLSVGFWSFGLFFLLVWIFVLGILVGRGFLPGGVTTFSGLKDQLIKVQDFVGRNQARDKRTQKKSEPDPKLLFYEKLSSKKGEVKQEPPPQRNPGKPKIAEKTTPEKKSPALKPLEDRIAVKKSETSPEETGSHGVKERKNGDGARKNRDNPAFPKMRYTVKLASMGEKGSAEEMIDGLIKRGFPAYHYEVKVDGRTFYRVRCGRFTTREKAEEFLKKLKKKAGVKGFVSSLE